MHWIRIIFPYACICNQIFWNSVQSCKNWNPIYNLTWKPHSSTKWTHHWQIYGLLHWHHFCDLVNSWQCTMEYMVPLGWTNKAILGAKLFSATVSAFVHCSCYCTLVNTKWLFFCSNVWYNLPFAPHPSPPLTPIPFYLPTPYVCIKSWGLDKNVLKSSSIS